MERESHILKNELQEMPRELIEIIIIIMIIIIIIMIIITIQIFTEEGLSHSRVLFMRVLYLSNCTDLLNHCKIKKVHHIKSG